MLTDFYNTQSSQPSSSSSFNPTSSLPLVGSGLDFGLGIWQGNINNNRSKDAYRENLKNQWDFYNTNNAYNSPIEQRKRMEAGGFNPAMMYGHGTVANTATNVNPSSRSTMPNPNLATASSGVGQYADLAMKTATMSQMALQKDLINKQIQNTEADTQLKNVNAARVGTDSARTQQQIDLANQLWNTTLEGAKKNVELTGATITEKAINNSTLDERNKANLANVFQQLALSQSTMDKQSYETELLKTSLNLRKMGINENDNIGVRFLGQFINGSDIGKDIKNKIKSILKSN